MYYYTFNIGDYRADTGHLSCLEHGIYRQLIDWYYLDEKPIPEDSSIVLRRLRLESEHAKTVLQVLTEFFKKSTDGWHHTRCDAELLYFHQKTLRNQHNGKLGGRPRKNQVVYFQNPLETQTKPQPITNNQEPITIKEKERGASAPLSGLSPDPVAEQQSLRINGKGVMIEEVIAYLNLQARRKYRAKNPNGTWTAHAEIIVQRLREGYTVRQLKDVVGIKSSQWMGDEKMDQYLNPSTLFRKANFTKYLAESEVE